MKILAAQEMRAVDQRTSSEAGISGFQLMENAGSAFVECMNVHLPGMKPQRVAVLCGKGNNGGDGFVIARKLAAAGWQVVCILLADAAAVRGDAGAHLRRWQESGGQIRVATTAEEWAALFQEQVLSCTVVVDALLGTGTAGPVEGLLAAVIPDVNKLRPRATIFSVDVPSGLPADGPIGDWPAVRADFTTTFTAPKVGLVEEKNTEFSGRLLVAQIGSPAALVEEASATSLRWSEPAEFRQFLCRRAPPTSKGTYGHALIVAGSVGKAGAGALAGIGALRAGAGLVTVATAETALPTVAGYFPELMTEPLASTESGTVSMKCLEYGRFEKLLDGKNVLALGPGVTTQPETKSFVRTVVRECKTPLVLDADGLNAFAGAADALKERATQHLVLTPHPGEMARLLGKTTEEVQAHRAELARACAARWRCHLILKGHRTVIAAPDGAAFINSTGNPGMATGGSGDVLTGILAGLTAQFGTQEWLPLLAFGVFLHGLAGDLAAARHGEPSLIASDLVAELGAALEQLRRRP